MTKAEARIIAKARRDALPEAEREYASGAIVDAVSSLEEFKRAKSVFIYLTAGTEPDTEELVGLALGLEKTVAVPRVRGEFMEAVAITPFTDFRRNKWNILEPVKGYIMPEVELAIVPLVAFDGLNRLGHGKGFYDKYLAAHKCTTVGLGFDCQRVTGLEADPYDVPLDAIVTEKRIITADGEITNIYGGSLCE